MRGTSVGAAARRAEASKHQAEQTRTRVRLLVQLTTRHGRYRRGLVQAAKTLTPQEASVLADLEAHGLDVNQLRDVLCGGHVLVDNPELYERWRFEGRGSGCRVTTRLSTSRHIRTWECGPWYAWPNQWLQLEKTLRRSVQGTGSVERRVAHRRLHLPRDKRNVGRGAHRLADVSYIAELAAAGVLRRAARALLQLAVDVAVDVGEQAHRVLGIGEE